MQKKSVDRATAEFEKIRNQATFWPNSDNKVRPESSAAPLKAVASARSLSWPVHRKALLCCEIFMNQSSVLNWLAGWCPDSVGLNLDPLCRRCDDIYSENPSWQAWWFYGLACLTGSWLGHQGDGVVEAVPIDRIYWLFIFRVRQK